MAKMFVEIRGKQHRWMVVWDGTQSQLDGMREDGIEVNELMNTIPDWIAACHLTKPWCFFQDVWNFKNPFKS